MSYELNPGLTVAYNTVVALANVGLILGPGHGSIPEIREPISFSDQSDHVTKAGNWTPTAPVIGPSDWRVGENKTFKYVNGQWIRTDFGPDPNDGFSEYDYATNREVGIFLDRFGLAGVRAHVAANAETGADEAVDNAADQALADSVVNDVRSRYPGLDITGEGVDQLGEPLGADRDAGDDAGVRFTLSWNAGNKPVYTKCERDVEIASQRTTEDKTVEIPYLVPPLPILRRRKDSGHIEEPVHEEPELSDRGQEIVAGYEEFLANGGAAGAAQRRQARVSSGNRLPRLHDLDPGLGNVALILAAATVATGAFFMSDSDQGICKEANSFSAKFCAIDWGSGNNSDKTNDGGNAVKPVTPNDVCPDATEAVIHVTTKIYQNGQFVRAEQDTQTIPLG